jgi:tetratricopeptide (TPR) repeat protein
VKGHTGNLLADQFRAVVPLGKSFIRLSRQQSLVLLLDDVQWADEASREVMGYLMRMSAGESLLLVAIMRSEEALDPAHAVAQWLKQQTHYRSYTSLSLAPLGEAEYRHLIEAVFSGGECAPDVPAADLHTLHRTTNGNPYFLMETLRLLVANGAIAAVTGARGQPRYQWNGMQDLPLPGNLVLAAQDKLERLSPEVRAVIEAAAVLGDEFRVETLALMLEQNEADVESALHTAVTSGVLSERGVAIDADYRFYHTVLRRVAYDQLTQRQRRRWHAQAAQSLERGYAHEADRAAEAISGHYEIAGDKRRTFEWSLRAWQAAVTRWQWRTAVACLERVSRAAEQISTSDPSALTLPERLRYLLGLGESYRAVGRLRESEQTLLRAASLAETLGETLLIGETAYQLAQTSFARGHYEATVAQAARAHYLLKGTAADGTATFAWLQAVSAKLAMGDYAAADSLTAMLPPVAQAPAADGIVALELLGWARVLQGHRSEGLPLLERALAARLSNDDVRQAAHLRRRLHLAYYSQGKYDASYAAALQAREDFRATGDAFGEAKASACLGQTRIAQGLYEEGLTFLSRTLASLQAIGDEHCEAEALWLSGRAQTLLGQYEAAHQSLTRALAMIRPIGDRDDEFRFLTDLARLHLARHAFAEAEAAAQESLTIAEELHNDEGAACAKIELSRAALLNNHSRQAAELAEAAAKTLDHETAQDRSGECWRAYWVWGQALLALEQDAPALAALRRAVSLLNEVRSQFGEHDKLRHDLAIQNLAPPACDLHALLLRLNQFAEATALAQSWQLVTGD